MGLFRLALYFFFFEVPFKHPRPSESMPCGDLSKLVWFVGHPRMASSKSHAQKKACKREDERRHGRKVNPCLDEEKNGERLRSHANANFLSLLRNFLHANATRQLCQQGRVNICEAVLVKVHVIA